jgi:hypothetical protein
LSAHFGEVKIDLLPGSGLTVIVAPQCAQGGTLLAWDCPTCPM